MYRYVENELPNLENAGEELYETSRCTMKLVCILEVGRLQYLWSKRMSQSVEIERLNHAVHIIGVDLLKHKDTKHG